MKLKIVTLLAALLSGGFLGLFSCGVYVWQEQAAVGIVAILTVASLARSEWSGRGWMFNTAYGLSILAAFFVTQALTAPFYPHGPESASEYFQGVLRSLSNGPC